MFSGVILLKALVLLVLNTPNEIDGSELSPIYMNKTQDRVLDNEHTLIQGMPCNDSLLLNVDTGKGTQYISVYETSKYTKTYTSPEIIYTTEHTYSRPGRVLRKILFLEDKTVRNIHYIDAASCTKTIYLKTKYGGGYTVIDRKTSNIYNLDVPWRHALLSKIDDNTILLYDYSDASEKMKYIIYNYIKKDIVSKLSYDSRGAFLAMYGSMPLGHNKNYIIVCEQGHPFEGDRFFVRLFRLMPFSLVDTLVLPKTTKFIGFMSAPINRSEVVLSSIGYPFVFRVRAHTETQDTPAIELITDFSFPRQLTYPRPKDIKYYEPWITWITDSQKYKLHFWDGSKRYYVLDLSEHTTFSKDGQFFPSYFMFSNNTQVLVYQKEIRSSATVFIPVEWQ